ncbi:MAG: glutamyl-tRNA reductase [Acidimicrobiales bacterium]|nr:glutamyl-tRNA reductase [Acidimicrobiales bacterium]
MSVVVIGLNHRSTPLDLLERMTIGDAGLPKALHDLVSREDVSEAVVLSTCNRTEVYAVAERFHGACQNIRDFLAEVAFLAPEDFSEHLYVHYDAPAVAHLFSLAAGLDSAVLGESEILGQVRRAWDTAREEGTAGPALNLLFRHALEAGKRARTDTGIARNITSVSQAAVAMAAERLGGLAGRRVLVLGAGEMGEAMALGLVKAGAAELAVANRTWERAVELADRVDGRAVRLLDVPEALLGVDVLLSSTGAAAPLLQLEDIADVATRRAGRPLLIVDIAVPRDVDPAAASLDGVTLLNMDDLRAFADAGTAARRREVGAVQELLDEELERYLGATSAREVAPMIVALRERAEEVRRGELERFRSRLEALDEAQLDAVEGLTRGIIGKLLHEPSIALKIAAGSPRGDRLVASLRELFALEGEDQGGPPTAPESVTGAPE